MALVDAARLVTLLAPLLVVALVAAVIASAWADGGMRGAEAQVDVQAREWAHYVFGSEPEAVESAPPSPLPVARQGEHG
ncbi:hypothetical protein SORBI_3001G118500 [Sorghum bicolor]|uniref:Secreted protein n=1 Tax=Sorghum bicolor TaxID=4558 RepID=A0A1B6QIK1_SORBI|nr:hypothetical protein SORBI_3001G118500 [Sorghum bicolor]